MEPISATLDVEIMATDEAVKTAKEMLAGNIGIVEGSRILKVLGFEITNQDHDPDFIAFIGIDSESDHIPLGKVREKWSSEGLKKMDIELLEIEDHYRTWALEACTKIIARFENGNI